MTSPATIGQHTHDSAAIAMRGVTFAYGDTTPIVREVSLTVPRGRTLALLGPNGCGKTTLLRLVTGILRPRRGEIDVRGRLAFVPQLTQLSFAYSALDMVLMGRARQIGLFATPSSTDEAKAAAALDRVGMLSFAMRTFDTLSGGERQLVLFARALASDADTLILDEPTAALDLAHQRMILERMLRLAHDDGMTIVFSTHQPDHAIAVADDVALMFRDGEFATGPVSTTLTPARLSLLFGIDVGVTAIGEGAERRDVFVPLWNLTRS
ncbi:MAG TPA: ABC transporter ATP-binding protein [Gemmatimonadaceae bacterium]